MSIIIPAKSPTVLFKEMDEGGVLFCTRTEAYFGVNEVGAAIWARLPDTGTSPGADVGTLVDALQERYPEVAREQLASDVREFLAALEEGELVVHADGAAPG